MKGSSMNIEYFEPLSRAWNRMTRALFRPFNLSNWLVLGFTAFLAGLLDSQGGGGGGSRYTGGQDVDWRDVANFPHTVWDWLMDHAVWFFLIMFGLAVVMVIGIILTWLSSRGKFMFLDNVVHERAKVIQPWHQFRREGNSLFLWRLVFGLICLAVFSILLIRGFFIATLISQEGFHSDVVMTIVKMVLFIIPVGIIIAYILLFLNNFVVPIMYINNVTASQAWGRFLLLFREHWIWLILYGLIVLILRILVIVCVIMVGLFTCCLGFILLAIPYIGTVILLPISYTFRAFSLEFLEQFGPDYTIFPRIEYRAENDSIYGE
jgi:hypothetical protein